MIQDKNKLFDELFLILKRESDIKNAEQAVEIISLFLLLQYISLVSKKQIIDTCNSDSYLLNLKNSNTEYLKSFYKNLIKDFFSNNNFNCNSLHKVIIHCFDSIFSRVDSLNIIQLLVDILSEISSLHEFYSYSESYRHLLERMVNESPNSGAFYTPQPLVELMVCILNPKPYSSIYDPVCGSAGFLVEAANYIEKQSNKRENIYKITGNDNSSFACLISLVSLLLNEKNNFRLNHIDSLFSVDTDLEKYDVILANPPFGKKSDILNRDKYSRYGSFIDYHFLKHIMDSLKIGGKASVILPERFFTDESYNCLVLKKELFSKFSIDSILSIPSGSMLPYTGVKICILFFSNTTLVKDIWVYNLNVVDKFTKKEPIKPTYFEDFLQKYKTKKVSENSWIVDVDDLKKTDNLLVPKKDLVQKYGELSESKISIDKLVQNHNKIIENFIKTKESIIELENLIKLNHSSYHFDQVKVQDITFLKTGVPLAMKKLLKNGDYPVYGGNGIIGYYNQYSESGETIVIGKVGALCGNVIFTQEKIWVTSNAMVMKNVTPKYVFTPYLSKVLSMMNLGELAVGTAQQYITIEKVYNIKVNLPPLDIQIQLSKWLVDLDNTLNEYNSLLKIITNDKENIKTELYKKIFNL